MKRQKVRDSMPDRLQVLLSGENTHPSELFRDVDDEFWLWINTEGREGSDVLQEMLPGLPDEERQRRWTGKTGIDTLTEGFTIYEVMRDLHNRHFGDLRDHGPVLDFGSGWGRVIRYFLKDVDPGQLKGTDHEESLVEFSRASNRFCDFNRNEAEPPLPYGDDEFGFVYAYSVFSHFSEPMHWKWLEEFKRIVRPGGALALTVRPGGFIEHCRRLRTGEAQGVSPINKKMFPDAETDIERYANGEFCFSPYNPDLEGAWWGEACIPRQFIDREWSKMFDIVEFLPARELKQHVVLLRA